MTTTDPAILEARELLAEEYIAVGARHSAQLVRAGNCGDDTPVRTVARILRERPVYTREQELEAMEKALQATATPGMMLDAYKRHLTALKGDPLVEAIKACDYATLDAIEAEFAAALRQALAARGLEIREVKG